VTPILKREAIDKEYLKGFEDLQKLLKRLQKTLSGPESERNYVYLLPSVLCGIIVPAEVEEAIRNTTLRDIEDRKKERSFIFLTTAYIISIIFKWSNTRELVYSEMVKGQLPHRILFEFKTEGVRAPTYPKCPRD
jgi:hypothetical protein